MWYEFYFNFMPDVRLNYVGPGSFIIHRTHGTDIDVYEELNKTRFVPLNRQEASSQRHANTIEFGDEVFDIIQKFVRSDGYAGLSLAEYLDGLFTSPQILP